MGRWMELKGWMENKGKGGNGGMGWRSEEKKWKSNQMKKRLREWKTELV